MSHALLSPSAAHRWLNCTKSVRLEEKFEDRGSDAAMEGTVAHAICAHLLKTLITDGTYDVKTVAKEVRYFSDEFTVDDFDRWYTQDMMGHAEDYASYVWGMYQKELETTPDAVLMVEKNLDITKYGQDMTGTTDAAIVSDKSLHIIDFKYGRGVRVDALNNPQMMIYALGNIEAHSGMYAFHDVVMTIYQPRLNNISDYRMTVDGLRKWGVLTLAPKAADAYAGKGEYAAGPWCKFCKAKALCKTCASYSTELYDNLKEKDLDCLSADELAAVVAEADDITSWLDAVKGYAVDQLKEGKPIAGLKLVEGRSTRRYADEGKVIGVLTANGFKEEQLYDKKIKTITAMEKMITKKVFASLLSDLVVKPQGSPTLALESDPRPAYNSAENDFSDLEI